MNRYDLPLAQPSKQSIIPAIHKDGRVIGFYLIASTLFTGTETEHTTSDGVVVPLKVVTIDANQHLRTVNQYVAAVFEETQSIQVVPNQYVVQRKPEPWHSTDLILGDATAYRWYTQASHTWFTHFGDGTFIGALRNNLDFTVDAPVPPAPPEAEDGEMEWRASIDYLGLFGDCAFFDFNWMTLFKTKVQKEPLRIVVVENPAPIPPSTRPPLAAKIIGRPMLTANGVIYDSIRILRLGDSVDAGEYVFKFQIVDESDLKTDVTFTLTVK
jgi:hypothetical protein